MTDLVIPAPPRPESLHDTLVRAHEHRLAVVMSQGARKRRTRRPATGERTQTQESPP